MIILSLLMFQANQMEEEEGDDEEMGVAETYADYWPAKCKKIVFEEISF